MPLELDYYYGNEAEQYSFYRIPKTLFTDGRFRQVSVEAKVLYGLLLDRMGLSVKNGWMDAEGRVYIIFTIAEIMGTLGCAEQKANKLLNELDVKKGVGLIEKKRRGLGKPNVIYVKNFVDKAQMPQKPQIRNCENHKSGNVKTASQELRKSQTNNTDLNNTDFSDTGLSIYPAGIDDPADTRQAEKKKMDGIGGARRQGKDSGKCGACGMNKPDGNVFPAMQGRFRSADAQERAAHAGRGGTPVSMERLEACRELVKENISYDALLHDRLHDRERLDGYVDLIAEVCCCGRGSVRVNQSDMPAEAVKGRLLKLGMEHVKYVMDCMDQNTSLVGNIRAYTLSALYNAPATISQYYASLVSHDMAEGAGAG